MTEGPVIWTITDADAQAAEDAQRAERLETLGAWAGRLADVLAVVHGVMRNKLPPRMAEAVTLEYAHLLLYEGIEACDDCACDDGADWREHDD